MLEPSQNFTIWKYDSDSHMLKELKRPIVVEHACELIVNGEKWLTFNCSPDNVEALGIGFLWNEAVIDNLDQVEKVELSDDQKTITIQLKTAVEKPNHFHRRSTGLAIDQPHGATPATQDFTMEATEIVKLYKEFNSLQELHGAVGGFHSASLCDAQKNRYVVEDLGQHNCVDKLVGLYLLNHEAFPIQALLLSGRINSEMIAKSLAMQIPVMVSRTSPTALAIQTAVTAIVTLIGYLRGNQFDVYSHPERLRV